MPFAYRHRIAALVAFAIPLPFAGGATAGEAVRYSLDPVHTRVMFAIEHAGFSKAIGTVSGSTGQLVFDAEDWRVATLRASVPMARVDMGDAGWNKAALAGNLLDVDDHPEAVFVSTRVEPIAPNRASVHGTLTLRGVSREIVLDVTLNAVKRHPLPPFRRTVGFSATSMLSRKAFGIDAWPSVIGDAVELRIEAEAVRSRADDGDDVDANAPDAPIDASSSPGAATTGALLQTTTEPAP
ncbi:MAG: YceI family protein [Pseudomonadota bacterium]